MFLSRLSCPGQGMQGLSGMVHLVQLTDQMGFIGQLIGPLIGCMLAKAAFVGIGSNFLITIIVAVLTTLDPRELL